MTQHKDAPFQPVPSAAEAQSPVINVYANPQSQRALELLRGIMHGVGSDATIIYPGSAADVQLAKVFGETVIHVDPDAASMDALRRHGLVAISARVEDYLPSLTRPIDVLFSYNAGIPGEDIRSMIRPGGYLIANNWHEAANAIGGDRSFDIVAAINPGQETLIAPDVARKGLGYTEVAITSGGNVIMGDEEIAKLEPGTYTRMQDPKNTEALWLFIKKDPGYSDAQSDNSIPGEARQ